MKRNSSDVRRGGDRVSTFATERFATNTLLRAVVVACCWTVASTGPIAAADLRIDSADAKSTVFAGGAAQWTFRIRSDEAWTGSAKWRLRHADRTLVSGEREVTAKPDQPGMLPVSIQWPSVKEGAALKLHLVVVAGNAEHSEVVWILPRDPFVDRREWLKQLQLKLLDADGSLADKWETLDLPFDRVKAIGGVDDLDQGTLVVNGGPEEKVGDWMPRMIAAARRGVSVVWLGTNGGRFDWPGEEDAPNGMQLRRDDLIRELDPRLDAGPWTTPSAGLKWAARRESVVAEIGDDRTAWPWCEWDFVASGGDSSRRSKLIWIGWRVTEGWEESPTPRFLLRAVLERIDRN